MMNIPKRDVRFLMLHELKLGHNAPKLLQISTEHGEMDQHVIGEYEGVSKNFIIEIRELKMKKVEHAVLITKNFKQLLSKILLTV